MDAPLPEAAARDTGAPAKINLALHVVGQRADGYHELDSLVVFVREGDQVTMRAAEHDGLEITGAFANGVPADETNIVLRALHLARRVLLERGRTLPPLAVHLRKDLPPSSGIGGGSADAAALLRLVAREHPDLIGALEAASVRLGADVPMCVRSRSARVTGVGDRIEPVAIAGPIHLLLVNPRVEVSTPTVFAKLSRRDHSPLPGMPELGFAGHDDLAAYLRLCRNDLFEPACTLAPVIGRVREAITVSGASIARMSGSGATVFGLFDSAARCEAARARLASAHPAWWVRATTLRTEEHL